MLSSYPTSPHTHNSLENPIRNDLLDAQTALAFHPDLLAELAQWEALRARLGPLASHHQAFTQTKTIIVLDAIPGAGKSTHLAWLRKATGAAYLSMARFAEARNVTQSARLAHQLETCTPHACDLELVDAIARLPEAMVVLEKFPRSPVEAALLMQTAQREGWRIDVLHLYFPEDPIGSSGRRQMARGPRHGVAPAVSHAARRAAIHLARATSGRLTMRQLGAHVHDIDTSRPLAQVALDLRSALGLDFARLDWHAAPLLELADVSDSLGVSAWAANGHVYRAFWNGRFGPCQEPTDVDVAVDQPDAVAPLLNALRQASPHRRWSVLCPAERLRERFGVEVATSAEAKMLAAFTYRTGLVRFHDGHPEVVLPEGAEADLRNGLIRVNPLAVSLDRASARAVNAVRDYPALRLDASTADLLGLMPLEPKRIATNWRAMKRDIVAPANTTADAFCRRALHLEELAIAEEILRFHQDSPRRAQAPPKPPAVADHVFGRSRAEFEFVAREASDDLFGDWFLEQVHHHNPRGGADPFVRSLLDFTMFKRLRKTSLEQSAMHQGWTLDRHLAASVLALRTDALLDSLRPSHDAQWLAALRLNMRTAMLFHDVGKLAGRTPKRHGRSSERIFMLHAPKWCTPPWQKFTGWLIRTHDLFGAFGRGLTDKRGVEAGEYAARLQLQSSYFAALDSQAVRSVLAESELPLHEALAVNKAVWRADIGAIAALRWLLPVAEMVERLLLAGASVKRVAWPR